MTSCLLNVAQCALKREQWFTAERVCTEVLGFLADPLGAERDQNAKALYRRAKARIGRSDFAEARADVRAAHQLEPSSRELHALWAELKEREVSANAQRDTSYSKGRALSPASTRPGAAQGHSAGRERPHRLSFFGFFLVNSIVSELRFRTLKSQI